MRMMHVVTLAASSLLAGCASDGGEIMRTPGTPPGSPTYHAMPPGSTMERVPLAPPSGRGEIMRTPGTPPGSPTYHAMPPGSTMGRTSSSGDQEEQSGPSLMRTPGTSPSSGTTHGMHDQPSMSDDVTTR